MNEEGHNRTLELAVENEKLMMEGLNQISNTVTNAVMVLGQTGSGKSAFINLLAGKPLVSRLHNHTREFLLESTDMLPGITIGNDNPSETSIPHSWIHNGNTAYWDCPGFNDNRGIEYEITNAFLIKKLFDANKNCKILIVVSDTDLNDRRAINLLSSIRALDNFFQSDVEKIKSGLMLVVSGANPDKTDKHIQETLRGIINAPQIALTDPQKELFQLFINNPIIIFKRPVVEGPFDISCAQEYLDKIESLGVINNLRVKSIISPASNLLVLETYTNLLRSINLEIDNLTNSLSLQLRNYITSSKVPQEPQKMTWAWSSAHATLSPQELNTVEKLRTAVVDFQAIAARFNNGVVLSNKQLLSEIVPQCMRLNINRHMEPSTSNLRNMLHKTEIFAFLKKFVDRDARVKLGIQAAITRYLSNGICDANSAIQAIEQNRLERERIALQSKLRREAAAIAVAEVKIEKTANAVETAKQALVVAHNNHQDRPSIVTRVLRSIFW